MGPVLLSDSGDYFVRDGKPFFYLADTVWSAFSTTTVEEWEELLELRRAQGFNALQISVLPVIHDASDTSLGLEPFAPGPGGQGWNFYEPDAAFFDRAERMVASAHAKGFVPVLGLLWNNFVPGTWANAVALASLYTMPKDAVRGYVDYVVKRFEAYHPIYFVSGDTKFEDDAVNEYFRIAMDRVKELTPAAITALHPAGNFHELPECFIQSPALDLYIYQSGHMLGDQVRAYGLAEEFLKKPVARPIINSEPCYEGHGHGMKYGRFGPFDMRRAFWYSVLGGAKAGFTYGAHGVWSWHRKGAAFNNEGWSKVPMDWRTALHFQGAWDVGYAAWLFGQYGLHEVCNAQELLVTPYEEIRVAASEDRSKVVVYAPYANAVRLALDLSGYEITVIELTGRNVIRPEVEISGGETVIGMTKFNSDVLILAVKR